MVAARTPQPIPAPPAARYTPQEYLDMEERAEYKSEYRNGVLVPMAGATINHNRIVSNTHAYLYVRLDDQRYEVFMSDMRIWIPQRRLYTYPDIVVIAGQPSFYTAPTPRKDTLTNPLLIVEVLSETTREYDRGEKFASYQTIESFQEYVLIEQERMRVEQFCRTPGNTWLREVHTERESIVHLSSVGLDIPVQDMYKRVEREQAQE